MGILRCALFVPFLFVAGCSAVPEPVPDDTNLAATYATNRARYERMLRTRPVGFRLKERVAFPALTGKLSRSDRSGTMADLRGYAKVPGVSRPDRQCIGIDLAWN
jgi:hypothetical protein